MYSDFQTGQALFHIEQRLKCEENIILIKYKQFVIALMLKTIKGIAKTPFKCFLGRTVTMLLCHAVFPGQIPRPRVKFVWPTQISTVSVKVICSCLLVCVYSRYTFFLDCKRYCSQFYCSFGEFPSFWIYLSTQRGVPYFQCYCILQSTGSQCYYNAGDQWLDYWSPARRANLGQFLQCFKCMVDDDNLTRELKRRLQKRRSFINLPAMVVEIYNNLNYVNFIKILIT